MPRYDVLVLALLLGSTLVVMHVRNRARIRTQRGGFFDACVRAFDNVGTRQNGIDYPVLSGSHSGHDVTMEAIADHASFRKLPQLLVMVTLRAPVPCRMVVDALARPQNTEFYSPWNRLPHWVERSPEWPAHVVVRANHPEPCPFASVLDRHLRMFDEPEVKELLISPRGVRVVYRVQEARRGPYLLLRQAVFQSAPLDGELAARLLNSLTALHADLHKALTGAHDAAYNPQPASASQLTAVV
jgi:hypothetical protein